MQRILAVVLAVVSAGAFAQGSDPLPHWLSTPVECSHLHTPPPTFLQLRRPYDVLHYKVVLDWRRPLSDSSAAARSYAASSEITLRCDTTTLPTIELDAGQTLAIDSVQMGNSRMSPTYRHTGNILAIDMPTPLHFGDQVTLKIFYRNISQHSVQQEFYGGYNRYWKPNDTLPPLPAPLAYTMSQPNNARLWMPCNDRPYDKAYATMIIAAPPGFTTLSNGTPRLLLLDMPDGTSVGTLMYESKQPISTYLMVAIASRYAMAQRFYKSIDSTRQIPLQLFLWRSDSTNYADNVQWLLDLTAQAMSVYERTLAPYPFDSYGQALLFPYFSGAMEHQTMTTLHRDALIRRWETVIVHELMHHWTGNLVTCAQWNDLWLNEGGATYGERLWIEYAYGEEQARRYFAARRNRDYLRGDGGWSQPPVYNTTGTNLFNTGTTYVKAGWIFHMMRTMLGDSTFFELMRAYFQRFAYGALGTEDFVAFCQQNVPNPPIPWRTFFDQWVYAVGHPILRAQQLWMFNDGWRYRLRLLITQIQDSSKFLPAYQIVLPLRCWAAGRSYDTAVVMREHQMIVELFVPTRPDSVELDPNDHILCQKDSVPMITSVADRTTPAHLATMLQRGTPIEVLLAPESVPARVRLFTTTGNCIADIVTQSPLATLSTSHLAPGVYTLLIEHGGTHRVTAFLLLP